jgi:hypothetical protein
MCTSGSVERRLARRTAPDRLHRAVVARNVDGLRLAGEQFHAVGLNQHVDDERAAGLPLTVQAVAAVHEERFGRQAVADGPTRAAAFLKAGHQNSLT